MSTTDWDKTGSDIDWLEVIGMGLEENRHRTGSPIPEVVVADIEAAMGRVCAVPGVSHVRKVADLLCGHLNEGDQTSLWMVRLVRSCRFVWAVGAIRESYPDVPELIVECEELVLWDRKHSRPVVSVAGEYAGLMGLELTNGMQPLTDLGLWINRLSPAALASEWIPI
ncbi:MAG: hypothetical protein IT581_12250 [Verrucomicrobiales bacterium]|nr:hypothetical protein [Verrucomicrobiales bacterium]